MRSFNAQTSLGPEPWGPSLRHLTMSRRGFRYSREQLGAQAAEGAVLGPDADREDDRVEEAEDDRHLPQAERQWQDRDLQRHDQVVRMIEQPVRPGPNEPSARLDDDAGRPALAESADDPDTTELKQN